MSRPRGPSLVEGGGGVCDNVVSAYRFTGMPQALFSVLEGESPPDAGDAACPDPEHQTIQENSMRKGIHPEYVDTVVTCTCGNTFHTRSTITSGEMRVDVCSACHPFYTGKQKILDTGGRVAKFEARYGKRVRPSK